MPPIYRIHPGIGIARLGDSPVEFYIGPEKPAALPTACDAEGNPLLSPDGKSEAAITTFKDIEGRIKRQAARFQIYVYDDDHPHGKPLKLGDPIEGGGNHGKLVDIQWRVHLANKKAVWYEFHGLQGEHGYQDSHPLRNAGITDEDARQQLIIDAGPRFVNTTDRRRAAFDRNGASVYAPVFPPPLKPNSIETLGDMLTDNQGRLLVLGGHGNSGSYLDGFGQPRIDDYANNDGWFDDISDGPVMARLVMYSDEVTSLRCIDVEYPAWVVVGYPRYAPQILDMVTADDVIYDLAVRQFAARSDIYGIPGTYDKPQYIDPNDVPALIHWNAGPLDWNPHYKPWFYRDVWPILFRADEMRYLNNILQQSNYPHDQTQRGNFDVTRLSVPPLLSRLVLDERQRFAVERNRSGELFLEAIELQLHVFDDVIDQSLRRKIKEERTQQAQGSGAPPSGGLSQLLRAVRGAVRRVDAGHDHLNDQALKAAAAYFAAKAMPDSAGLSPGEYLDGWKRVYNQGGASFTEAKDQFRATVDAALEPFIVDAIARWSHGVPASSALAAYLRAGENSGQPGTLIDQVVRDAVAAIESKAMTDFRDAHLMDVEFRKAYEAATNDPYRDFRMYLYKLLRRPGEENAFKTAGKPESRLFRLPLMPLLAGDNPGDNNLPSKFLRLTDYQLYILRQWAEGKFYNEVDERWVPDTDVDPFLPYQHLLGNSARDLDQGVLMNVLGGAFYPGAEVCWLIRNPSAYKVPYRFRADPDFYNFGQTAANQSKARISEQEYLGNSDVALSQKSNLKRGLQPGDVTKYSALPWQADFNECSTQTIDITYELWNSIDPRSEKDPWLKLEQQTWETLWWPAHRPLQAFEVTSVTDGKPNYDFLGWSRGVPQTLAGDLKMVTEWARLGFLIRNPYVSPDDLDKPSPDLAKYISVERNKEDE